MSNTISGIGGSRGGIHSLSRPGDMSGSVDAKFGQLLQQQLFISMNTNNTAVLDSLGKMSEEEDPDSDDESL